MAFDSVYLEIASPHRPSSPAARVSLTLQRPLGQGASRSSKLPRIAVGNSPTLRRSRASALAMSAMSSPRFLDREWAKRNDLGLSLTAPRALLDAWSAAYERTLAAERRFYTTLHGSILEEALRDLFRSAKGTAHLAVASFSAAQWISPFGRTATQYFYADEDRVDLLKGSLRLSSASKGEKRRRVDTERSSSLYFWEH